MPSSRGSSDPGIKPVPLKSPSLAGGFFTTSTTGEGPTPFQTLLILAPERLWNQIFTDPILLSLRYLWGKGKFLSFLDQQATVALLSPLAHSGLSATNYFLYLFHLVFFFLSRSFILLLLLFPPPNPPLLLLLFCLILLLHLLFLLCVHMLSGAHKGVGHLFYFGVFLINRDRQIQWFSSSVYLGWR